MNKKKLLLGYVVTLVGTAILFETIGEARMSKKLGGNR